MDDDERGPEPSSKDAGVNNPYERLFEEVMAETPDEGLVDADTEKLHELSPEDKNLVNGLAPAVEGARSLEEFRSAIIAYLSKDGKLGPSAYLKENFGFVESNKGPHEIINGWYQPIPGDLRSELLMAQIDVALSTYLRKNMIQRARDRIAVNRDVKREKRAADAKYDEAWEEAQEYKTSEQREAERLEMVKAELLRVDAEEKALEGPDSFEEYSEQKLKDAMVPIQEELVALNAQRVRMLGMADSMPMLRRKDLEARFTKEAAALYKKLADAKSDAEKSAETDHNKLVDGLFVQSKQIQEFQSTPDARFHIYMPDKETPGELRSLIANTNSRLLGRHSTPFQVDEYDLPHDKQYPTRMQRMIFKTDHDDVLVIEDWDKTSGKLMRQSVMRGNDLLIPDYDNDGVSDFRANWRIRRGNVKDVLSDEVYRELGVLGSDDVIEDAGTSAIDSYGAYVRNLTRSGGVGLDVAKNLARPELKPKANKGFIKMLQEEWAKSKAKSTKKQ